MNTPIQITAHIEGKGDVTSTGPQAFVGTRNQGLRLEGFSLLSAAGIHLEYMAHIQDIGDSQWVSTGQFVGTKNQGKRLEGFAVRLSGPRAHKFDVKYYAHCQGSGDTPVVSNGQFAGQKGQQRRVEGMAVWLEKRETNTRKPKSHARGMPAPPSASPFVPMAISAPVYPVPQYSSATAFSPSSYPPTVFVPPYSPSPPTPSYSPVPAPAYSSPIPYPSAPSYSSIPSYASPPAYAVYAPQPVPIPVPTALPPVQTTVFIQGFAPITTGGGAFAGAKGAQRKMEAFQINGVDIEYMAHIELRGDTEWHRAGQLIGAPGSNRRIEGLGIRLVGHSANLYNIKYYGHLQDQGDSPVGANGSFVGTKGQSRRLEGICVWLEPKHAVHYPY